MLDGPAKSVAEGIRRKLDAAAISALRDGKDWAEGPIKFVDPDPWDPNWSIFTPLRFTASVKAGPVEKNEWHPPHGWRVIRHDDWIAAGRPGDVSIVDEVMKPRCGCPREVARKVILEGGTCRMGGCPYGGDV